MAFSQQIQDQVYKQTNGNLKVLKFKTRNQVDAEVQRLRDFRTTEEQERDEKLVYDDSAKTKFEIIYDISPDVLGDILSSRTTKIFFNGNK